VKYNPRKSEAELDKFQKEGNALRDYDGMMPQMENGSLVIDDLNHHEAEILIEKYKPDLFCAGIKEKYVVQKQGIPLKQLHSYDYQGPYAGFVGAINFYKEIDRLVNTSIFRFVKAPWQATPELSGSYGWEK
jgi:nitrogenase molybdenum-iron protein alpha chain